MTLVFLLLDSVFKHGCTHGVAVKALTVPRSSPWSRVRFLQGPVLLSFFPKLAYFLIFYTFYILIFCTIFICFHNFISALKNYQKLFSFLHYFQKTFI